MLNRTFIFPGRQTGIVFEDSEEITGVVVPDRFGDLGDIENGVFEDGLRIFDAHPINVIGQIFAALFLENITAITGVDKK